jgi:riboflavin kinase/FMN adenylyltransferase
MTILRNLDRLPENLRHGAVAIGNFDGVHLGHAKIVSRLLALAREVNGPAVVFTFDPHPVRLLRPHHAPPPLTWTDRKAELLAELGIDAVIAYPTDEAFLNLSAHEFFDEVVRRRLDAKAMVEGINFFFGRDRLGNVDLLRRFCEPAGMKIEIVKPVQVAGQIVSSSRIRSLVAQGQVEEARQLLTRPYRMRGMVVHGAGRGRKLGFPTANLEQIGTLLPGEGIYAGRTTVDGRVHPAAINLGPNPTFGEGALKVEVHLLDYEGWLYDRVIEVDFLARLRDCARFDSVEDLLNQMSRDLHRTRQIAADYQNREAKLPRAQDSV